MELHLKAKHFKNTVFGDDCNCAIAKAAKEHFATDHVSELLDILFVNHAGYKHELYNSEHFSEDFAKAEASDYNDTIVRTIELKTA